MRISSPLAVLCIDVVALGLLGIFYALIAGAILYGIAVCVVFLREPLPTVVAATRNFPLGLGLLCALVSVGAFAGRCLRKLSATAKNLVRTTGSPFRGAAPDAHDVQSKSDG